MELTRKLAYASWVVIVLYMFANRFVALLIGKVTTDLLALFLAIAGLILAIFCLVRMRRYGRRGILGPAVAGLVLNLLILCIWIPNFLAARDRARAARAEAVHEWDTRSSKSLERA